MRIHSTFHIFVVLTVVLTFSTSFGTLAQENLESIEAEIAATRDAEADVKKLWWFGAGCLLFVASIRFVSALESSPYAEEIVIGLSVAGIAGSYFYRPDPPIERFLGKSPEYVAFYTDAYKVKRGKLQATWTTIGCASGGLAVGALVAAFVIAVFSNGW